MDSFYLVSIALTLITVTFLYGDYNSIQDQQLVDEDGPTVFEWILAQVALGDPVLNLSPLAAQVLRMVALVFALFGVAVTNETWVIWTILSILLDLVRAGVNGHWIGLALALAYLYPHASFLFQTWENRREFVVLEQDGWCKV